MNMNISTDVVHLADVIRLIGQPVRIQILLILANNSACVCHIEAVTGIRQAAISQQLTILRKAGLVQAAREGRNIFYSLSHPDIIQSIYKVASVFKNFTGEPGSFFQQALSKLPMPQMQSGNGSRLSL